MNLLDKLPTQANLWMAGLLAVLLTARSIALPHLSTFTAHATGAACLAATLAYLAVDQVIRERNKRSCSTT
jgi:adenosylmethionine-8-amino-7-oxononanoate aminotransferase